jgi:hypothetical protein
MVQIRPWLTLGCPSNLAGRRFPANRVLPYQIKLSPYLATAQICHVSGPSRFSSANHATGFEIFLEGEWDKGKL